MKTNINLGLTTVSLLLISAPNLPLMAQISNLPKVGVIKNKELIMGAGCYYNFVNDQSKRTILADNAAGNSFMNLDGKDTKLKRISTKSTKTTATTVYAANQFRIRVDNIQTGKVDYTSIYKTKITISQADKSRVISAAGTCGD
jgi:hypothetical protein